MPLLQSIGQLSIAVTGAITTAGSSLESLPDRMAAPGATFLDVGTGVTWLAVAMARSHPHLRVIGIDVFEPALDLAKSHVTSEELAEASTCG